MQAAEFRQFPSPRRTSGRSAIVTILALVASGGAISLGWNAASTPSQTPTASITPAAASPTPAAVSAPVNRDEEYRKLAIGTWETNRSGRRVLVVNPDGTATMDVTVEGVWSYAVGERIKLNINWKIENEHVTFETVGGEPVASVDVITSYYGKRNEQPIVELNATTFRLHDNEPSEPDHVYTRIGTTP